MIDVNLAVEQNARIIMKKAVLFANAILDAKEGKEDDSILTGLWFLLADVLDESSLPDGRGFIEVYGDPPLINVTVDGFIHKFKVVRE